MDLVLKETGRIIKNYSIGTDGIWIKKYMINIPFKRFNKKSRKFISKEIGDLSIFKYKLDLPLNDDLEL